MAITGNKITIPAKTFDKYEVIQFNCDGKTLNIVMQAYNDAGDRGPLVILDRLVLADRLPIDAIAAGIYSNLIAWIQALAKEQGKI